MPLHPQAKSFLDQLAAMGGTPMDQMTPVEARADREKAAAAFRAMAGPLQPVTHIEDRTIPGPAKPIPVRVYSPDPNRRLPVLVYFHGGGWVIGNIEQVDPQCRALANQAQCVVVNVDYRLAPEHKYPAAADDAFAVVRYVAAHPDEFSIDPARIAVGGDSAGGNLATVGCLMARDQGGPKIAFQLLVYPVTDYDDNRASTNKFAEGHLLTKTMMSWFWGHYVSSPEQGREQYASPINAKSLAGLPPAFVLTAECDPIRDQGEAYAERLRQAGVSVKAKRYEGAIHVFFNLGGVIDSGKEAIADSAAALRDAFAASTATA
jgi:acetyl esterase